MMFVSYFFFFFLFTRILFLLIFFLQYVFDMVEKLIY